MKSKYLVALSVAAASILVIGAIGIASAQTDSRSGNMMSGGMGGMMGLMQAHDAGDVKLMKEMMKEHHSDLTDDDTNNMIKSCPMMRAE